MEQVKAKRVTLSLPPELVHNLTYIAERMKVSRSALVSELMVEPIGDLYRLTKAIPEDLHTADKDTVKRARGDSLALIEARMDSLQRTANDLFSSSDPQA